MDDLLDWLKSADVKDAIPLDEEPDPALVRRVIVEGYAPNLNEHELMKLGRDPFLIAYALVNPAGRRIVTTEVLQAQEETGEPQDSRCRQEVRDRDAQPIPVCKGAGLHDQLEEVVGMTVAAAGSLSIS